MSHEDSGVTRKGLSALRHVRKFVRNAINVPTRVEILLEDGQIFTTGTALIRDISLRGARIGQISLKKHCLPCEVFRVFLSFRSPETEGIEAMGRPVRFTSVKEFELAIEFDDISVHEGEERPRKSGTSR